MIVYKDKNRKSHIVTQRFIYFIYNSSRHATASCNEKSHFFLPSSDPINPTDGHINF